MDPKPKIESIDDLNAERAQLKNQLQLSKTRIRTDLGMNQTGPGSGPGWRSASILGSFLVNRNSNRKLQQNQHIVNTGIVMGVDAVIRKTGLSRLPWPVRLALPFLMRNAASNFVYGKGVEYAEQFLIWVKEKTADPIEPTPLETQLASLTDVEEPEFLSGREKDTLSDF